MKCIEKYSIFQRPISTMNMILFFRQLTTLILSSIPILQAFELLHTTQENENFKQILLQIQQQLEQGIYLSTSLKKFPHYFDSMTCHLIMIGEKSGTFSLMLELIAHQKEKAYQLKVKLLHSLFYPSIITLVSIVIFFVMLIFIVPRFNELFHEMHVPLPTLTWVIVCLSSLILSNAYAILLSFFICFFFFKAYGSGLKSLTPLLNNIPFYFKLKKNLAIVHFTRYLSITLKAGMPLNEALHLIAHTQTNPLLDEALHHLKLSIEKGEKIHASMQKICFFPELLIGMIKVGEESGMLEQVLEKSSVLYENEVSRMITYFSDLLEPLIMIILGVLIGTLIIAMYLPIFNLGTLM